MELSLFLAKLFGIYLLVVGALFAVRGPVILETVEELLANRSLMFLSGIIALIIGIAMIVGHSVWELNWRGLITLFGYLSFAKGIVRIGFPEFPRKALRLVRSDRGKWVWFGVTFLLGAYLTWVGFTTSG